MIIYMVRNKINNKIYFGQTTKSGFEERYGGNFPKNCSNDHIKASIKKYGWENFEVVEEFDTATSREELNDLEEMYIKMRNTIDRKYGYNKKHGGKNYKLSEELKEKHFRRENHPRAREVHQYSESGEYIKTWSYLKEASIALGILDTSIISCCRGKFKSAGGYQWSYEKLSKMPPIEIVVVCEKTRVYQYDEEGNFIREWDCLTQAEEELKAVKRQHIGKCCMGKRKSAGGYQWRYASDVEDRHKNIGRPNRQPGKRTGKAVLQYSLEGQLIRKWNMMIDVEKELGISPTTITRCCKGKQSTSGGFIWKYAE